MDEPILIMVKKNSLNFPLKVIGKPLWNRELKSKTHIQL